MTSKPISPLRVRRELVVFRPQLKPLCSAMCSVSQDPHFNPLLLRNELVKDTSLIFTSKLRCEKWWHGYSCSDLKWSTRVPGGSNTPRHCCLGVRGWRGRVLQVVLEEFGTLYQVGVLSEVKGHGK